MPPREGRRPWDRLTWVRLALRTTGWMEGVISIVVLAYIAYEWPKRGGTIAAGMLGAVIALLNDSVEVAGIVDPTRSFPRLTPPRVLLYDLLALAVSLGGIILILFSELGRAYSWAGWGIGSYDDGEQPTEDDTPSNGPSRRKMTVLAMWMLGSIAFWRFVFCIWACCDGTSNVSPAERRRRERRRRERRRRELEEAIQRRNETATVV